MNKFFLNNFKKYSLRISLFLIILSSLSSCYKTPTEAFNNPNDAESAEFIPTTAINKGFSLIIKDGIIKGVRIGWESIDSYWDSVNVTKIIDDKVVFTKWFANNVSSLEDTTAFKQSFSYTVTKMKNGNASSNTVIPINIPFSINKFNVQYYNPDNKSQKAKLTWVLPPFYPDSIYVNRIVNDKVDSVFKFYSPVTELIDDGSATSFQHSYEVVAFYKDFKIATTAKLDYSFKKPSLKQISSSFGGLVKVQIEKDDTLRTCKVRLKITNTEKEGEFLQDSLIFNTNTEAQLVLSKLFFKYEINSELIYNEIEVIEQSKQVYNYRINDKNKISFRHDYTSFIYTFNNVGFLGNCSNNEIEYIKLKRFTISPSSDTTTSLFLITDCSFGYIIDTCKVIDQYQYQHDIIIKFKNREEEYNFPLGYSTLIDLPALKIVDVFLNTNKELVIITDEIFPHFGIKLHLKSIENGLDIWIYVNGYSNSFIVPLKYLDVLDKFSSLDESIELELESYFSTSNKVKVKLKPMLIEKTVLASLPSNAKVFQTNSFTNRNIIPVVTNDLEIFAYEIIYDYMEIGNLGIERFPDKKIVLPFMPDSILGSASTTCFILKKDSNYYLLDRYKKGAPYYNLRDLGNVKSAYLGIDQGYALPYYTLTEDSIKQFVIDFHDLKSKLVSKSKVTHYLSPVWVNDEAYSNNEIVYYGYDNFTNQILITNKYNTTVAFLPNILNSKPYFSSIGDYNLIAFSPNESKFVRYYLDKNKLPYKTDYINIGEPAKNYSAVYNDDVNFFAIDGDKTDYFIKLKNSYAKYTFDAKLYSFYKKIIQLKPNNDLVSVEFRLSLEIVQ